MEISKADLKMILMFGAFSVLMIFLSFYFKAYAVGASLFGLMLVVFLVPHMYGSVWFPSERAVVERMVRMAGIKSGDVVYDLGSGDGRILTEVWKRKGKKKNLKLIGVDISPFAVAASKLNVRLRGLQGKIDIRRQNLFRANLKDADVIFVFLTQETNDRLERKLKKELKKGTRVVSHIWKFRHMKLAKADEKLKVYLYMA